jgi:AcrR family transcriptional regulator
MQLPKAVDQSNHSTVTTIPGVAKAGPRNQPGGEELRTRLIDAAVRVLARDGFAHASARAIAQEAGTVNGSIFYYFASMDGLLAATAKALAERGTTRIRNGLGGDQAHVEWPNRLSTVMRAEAEGEDGRAVMELFVGARTSLTLAAEVRAAIDQAIEYATNEMQRVLGTSPVTQLIPVDLIAELAAAAFLGIEVLAQNGRDIDLERIATTLAAGVRLLAPR